MGWEVGFWIYELEIFVKSNKKYYFSSLNLLLKIN